MTCPYCGNLKSRVKGTVSGFKNLRMRACPKCGNTWRTKEEPVVSLYMKEYIEYLGEIGEVKDVDSLIQKDSNA